MDNKSLVKADKESILKKLTNFINKIFGRKRYIKNKEEQKETYSANGKNQINELYKVNIPEEVNSNIINESKRKRKLLEVIQIIEENPETLEKLDVSRLEIIDNYYKERIMEYKKKIASAS